MSDIEDWIKKHRSVWTRVYDEVIAPAVEVEWAQRSVAYKTKIKLKEEHHQILLNHVNNEVIQAARLREENARLRALLHKYGDQSIARVEPDEASTAGSFVSIVEYRSMTEKFDELNKEFLKANERLKYLERKNVTVMQKNREMKENVKAWQDYCDRHVSKQKTRSVSNAAGQASTLTFTSTSGGSGLPPSSVSIVHHPPEQKPPEHMRSTHLSPESPCSSGEQDSGKHVGDTSDQQELHDAESSMRRATGPPQPASPTALARPHHPVPSYAPIAPRGMTSAMHSSQSTEDDGNFPLVTLHRIKNEVDDDAPQIVSERSLKRKRRHPGTSPDHAGGVSFDGTFVRPIRVKEEQTSSPPLVPKRNLSNCDTMDLDEVGLNVVRTPGKRSMRTQSILLDHTGTLQEQRSNSAPFEAELLKTEAEEKGVEHGLDISDLRALSEPGDRSQQSQGVLQPLNMNIIANLHESDERKDTRNEMLLDQTRYNILAESGELLPWTKKLQRVSPRVARDRHNRRLKVVQDGPPAGTPIFRRPKTVSSITTDNAHDPGPARESKLKPAACIAPKKLPSSFPQPSPSHSAKSERRPVEQIEPLPTPGSFIAPPRRHKQNKLCSKPLSELRARDFKPNPTFNQGYTHAFSETVRKRADRLCLPGCTLPTCCGSTFRTLAAASAPLTPPQEEVLLRDYLGDAYDSFGLSQMEDQERRELVLQARTRQMAMHVGKHRQAYEGRKSPPGFWRVGFPSTQEEEEDRERAAQMEKEAVREKWLEANRKGGRWIFADE